MSTDPQANVGAETADGAPEASARADGHLGAFGPHGWTVAAIAERVGGTVIGEGSTVLAGMEAVEHAGATDLTFLASHAAARRWAESGAGAALISRRLLPEDADPDPAGRPMIVVPDAESAITDLLEAVAPPLARPQAGIDPTAVVATDAILGPDVRVGPFVTVGPGCVVGAEVTLHAGVRLGAAVRIGDGTTVHANAAIMDRCRIGARVTLFPGVVIGADGFGFRPALDTHGRPVGLRKIPQIGTVIIEDDVEIGACSCVDRAKFGATIIGAGTKLDNLCQIGHNCRVGRCCVIAGNAGLAGSVIVGDWCQIGGGACLSDHVTVGDGARIAGMCGVYKDVPAGATVAGVPGEDASVALRQQAALRKLPDLLRRLPHDPGPGRE